MVSTDEISLFHRDRDSLVVKVSDRGWRVQSSGPVPLKTRCAAPGATSLPEDKTVPLALLVLERHAPSFHRGEKKSI
ncbi:hypothetical protein TNCV_586771 [Trichonephila clavipes]|nr:hypothetical protein TNCV_586771 [Trichonephila clavipes]